MTRDALNAALATCRVELEVSAEAYDRLHDFVALRARWAKTHNLAGPKALADPWRLDVLDALLLHPVLVPDRPLVDVGSGSGLPGVVLACVQPERSYLLVEPSTKRVAFLRHAIRALGLKHTQVAQQRWPIAQTEPCQVVSRAVIDPAKWPLLASEGGPHVQDILRMLAAQRPQLGVEGFELSAEFEATLPGGEVRRLERWRRTAP